MATVRALRAKHGRYNAPTERTIKRIITKLENYYILHDIVARFRQRKARSEGNIVAVPASVAVAFSDDNRANFALYLALHPYKILFAHVQELKRTDLKRSSFADWALEMMEDKDDFH